MTSAAAADGGFYPGGSLSGARRVLLMSALVVSTVLASLDSSFVPIAFADMIDDLDTNTATVVWVALGYLIAATGPMLFFSRLGEAIGQVRFFQIGTLIYAVAMSLCAFAPSVDWLIVLRVVQGFGMAMFLPSTFAIASQIYPESHRGRALGILQSANAAGFLFGPIFAGFLLDAFDWRAIFSSRIPFALLAIIIAFTAFGKKGMLIELKKRAHYDITGALFLTVSFFGILYGLNRLPVEDNHLEGMVWVTFIIGIAFFILFLQQERLSKDPLVDLVLFRKNQAFAKSSIAFAALFASFPVHLFIWPLLLLSGMEISAWQVGLIMAVPAVATTVISPVAGRLADSIGAELLCFIGTIICAAGYLTMLFVEIDSSTFVLLIPMVLIGTGTGLFFSPNNSLIMGSVPPERAGMASGLIGTLRQSGYAIGFAVIASLFTAVQDGYEKNLTSYAVEILNKAPAEQVSQLFDGGGIWSPSILLYIFHMTVIICTAVLLLTLLNSIPKLKMGGMRELGATVVMLLVAVFGSVLYVQASRLTPGSPTGNLASSHMTPTDITPFGWASRHVEVAPRQENQMSGKEVFLDRCSACHGETGQGIEGLGLNLTTSSFIAGLDDQALEAFIKNGRMVTDPANVTGRVMPPNPGLEEGEYAALIQYLRRINKP